MGTTLLKHSQFVTVENNSINIYEQNSGEYVLLKSFAYADLGIDSYYETIKSGVYDEVNKCYYMILLNSNSSYKNLGYVVKYLPETTAIVTLGSFNCTWDKYNAMKNVFPSPTNPKLFFINVYQPKSGLICLYIKDDDTITRFQVPVNYENKYAEILSYGISSNNYIFMRRSDESYGFKIDYNSNSSVALTNDTGYTICTCSQDGSVCVVFKDDIYYLAELNISNYIISIILITSLPSGCEPLIFTNVTDTLLIRDTDKSQLAFLTYKDNKFSKIYIQAVNTDFIKVSAFGTGKEFLSDGSGIFAYMTSTSGILNYLSYNTKTISSLVLDGITLYNTNGTTATANNIVEGKTAYVNGGKVEGNIKEIGGSIYSADTVWVDNDLNTLMMQDDSRDYDAVIRANGVLGIGANLDAVAEVIDLTPDKIVAGNTILGIEGTAEIGSGGIKQFSTINEMQADETATEGNLAVVYREEMKNMTAETQTQIITFPATVVLPEVFNSSVYTMLSTVDSSSVYFDGQVELSQTQFRFNGYTNNGSITVTYTSTDGITYTRTTTDEIIDCGALIACSYVEEWDDNLGYFMQIGGNYFEGLFEYQNKNLTDVFRIYNYISSEIPNKYIKVPEIIMNMTNSGDIPMILVTEDELDESGLYYNILKCKVYTGSPIIQSTLDGKHYITCNFLKSAAETTKVMEYREYDFTQDNPLTLVQDILKSDIIDKPIGYRSSSPNYIYYVLEEISEDYETVRAFRPKENSSSKDLYLLDMDSTDMSAETTINWVTNSFSETKVLNVDRYFLASTQFNATSDDVYDKIFYGKNGVEEGSLQNITNIDKETFRAKLKIRNSLNNFSFTEGTSLSGCFSGYAEKYLPNMDTTNVTSLQSTFYNCANLVDVPLFNTLNLTSIYKAFESCPNLSDESLNNILAMCTNATKITSNKTLQLVGLTEEQATRCTTLSNYEAFVAAGWTTGY